MLSWISPHTSRNQVYRKHLKKLPDLPCSTLSSEYPHFCASLRVLLSAQEYHGTVVLPLQSFSLPHALPPEWRVLTKNKVEGHQQKMNQTPGHTGRTKHRA